jgi:hypothetical protein
VTLERDLDLGPGHPGQEDCEHIHLSLGVVAGVAALMRGHVLKAREQHRLGRRCESPTANLPRRQNDRLWLELRLDRPLDPDALAVSLFLLRVFQVPPNVTNY